MNRADAMCSGASIGKSVACGSQMRQLKPRSALKLPKATGLKASGGSAVPNA